MNVLHLENQEIYLHKYSNYSIKVSIPITKTDDVVVAYNPISNLYNEETYEEESKSSFKPFNHNLWYISKDERTKDGLK
jgi:hypothetical protein